MAANMLTKLIQLMESIIWFGEKWRKQHFKIQKCFVKADICFVNLREFRNTYSEAKADLNKKHKHFNTEFKSWLTANTQINFNWIWQRVRLVLILEQTDILKINCFCLDLNTRLFVWALNRNVWFNWLLVV